MSLSTPVIEVTNHNIPYASAWLENKVAGCSISNKSSLYETSIRLRLKNSSGKIFTGIEFKLPPLAYQVGFGVQYYIEYSGNCTLYVDQKDLVGVWRTKSSFTRYSVCWNEPVAYISSLVVPTRTPTFADSARYGFKLGNRSDTVGTMRGKIFLNGVLKYTSPTYQLKKGTGSADVSTSFRLSGGGRFTFTAERLLGSTSWTEDARAVWVQKID